ncbi:MAG TPA: histidine kinase, partial [Deltaproteobacteria bacterium]|nr:histidine kinase [Deltaproteobacteria bacterium]
LSEMESSNLSFGEALSQAQDLGFAEQDPSNDIKGIDARYKLVILTYLITGQWFTPEQIP